MILFDKVIKVLRNILPVKKTNNHSLRSKYLHFICLEPYRFVSKRSEERVLGSAGAISSITVI